MSNAETARAYAREWRRNHPREAQAAWDRYHAANPEAKRLATAKWQTTHPDEVRANWRKQARKKRFRKYGVSAEWYRNQLVGQAGRCALCWDVFASEKDTHIDHCHKTGRVRGLLCRKCNTMLGLADDSPDRLREAIAYLGGS